jgi:hypothetical protein
MCVVGSTVITNLGGRRGPFIKKLVQPLDTSHDKGRAVCNLPELPPICRKSQFLGCEVLWKTVKKASRVCLLEAFAVLLLVASSLCDPSLVSGRNFATSDDSIKLSFGLAPFPFESSGSET